MFDHLTAALEGGDHAGLTQKPLARCFEIRKYTTDGCYEQQQREQGPGALH
jgi:hypothetical protein